MHADDIPDLSSTQEFQDTDIGPAINQVFKQADFEMPWISTWQKISVLGKSNVSALLLKAESHKREEISEIAHLTIQYNTLNGMTGHSFRAKGHRGSLTPPQAVLKKDNLSRYYFVPIPEDIVHRKPGSTTFSYCGWCKHNFQNTNHTGKCSLFGVKSPSTEFFTKCLLHMLSADCIQALSDEVHDQLIRLSNHLSTIESGIRMLQSIIELSVEKPCIPQLRSEQHFKKGDKVVLNIRNIRNSPFKKDWVAATVHSNSPSEEGLITLELTTPITPGQKLISCEYQRPEVLPLEDWNYLVKAGKEDPIFFKMWTQSLIEQFYLFDYTRFIEGINKDNLLSADPLDNTTNSEEQETVPSLQSFRRIPTPEETRELLKKEHLRLERAQAHLDEEPCPTKPHSKNHGTVTSEESPSN